MTTVYQRYVDNFPGEPDIELESKQEQKSEMMLGGAYRSFETLRRLRCSPISLKYDAIDSTLYSMIYFKNNLFGKL